MILRYDPKTGVLAVTVSRPEFFCMRSAMHTQDSAEAAKGRDLLAEIDHAKKRYLETGALVNEQVHVDWNDEAHTKTASFTVPPNLGYAVEQRLRFVDFLLAQYGHIQRSALVNYFGIGEATATRDLGAYHAIAPGNMTLNPSDKIYYRTQAFTRVWQ